MPRTTPFLLAHPVHPVRERQSSKAPWHEGRAPLGTRPPKPRLPDRNVYCSTFGFGSSLAAHRPLLKSEKSTCPFHGIAFITNGALGV